MDIFYRCIKILCFYKPKKFSNHILVKSKSGFTTTTDFSIGQKELITTTNVHTKNPQVSSWLCAQSGVFSSEMIHSYTAVNLWIINKLTNNGAPRGTRTPNLLIRSQQIFFMHLWYNKNNSLVKQKPPIERLAFCQAKPGFRFCQAHIRRFFIHSTSDYNDSTSWSRQWVYEALWFPFHYERYDQHRSCCWEYS